MKKFSEKSNEKIRKKKSGKKSIKITKNFNEVNLQIQKYKFKSNLADK